MADSRHRMATDFRGGACADDNIRDVGAPNPSRTSYFALQYSVSGQHVQGVEWRVPVYNPEKYFSETSPVFEVLRNRYQLEVHCRGRYIKLMLVALSLSSPIPGLVTAELIAKEGSAGIVDTNSLRYNKPACIFRFHLTQKEFQQISSHLHLTVRFEYLSNIQFSRFSKIGEPSTRGFGVTLPLQPWPLSLTNLSPFNAHEPMIKLRNALGEEKTYYHILKERNPEKSMCMALKRIGETYTGLKFEPFSVDRDPTQMMPDSEDQVTPRMSYQNSSDCLNSLSADLMTLYEDSSHHDVKLLCEGQTISAHRSILSARSKIFRNKLQSKDHQNGCLEVKDMTFPVLRHLLRYMYTASLPNLTKELAAELSVVADNYAIGALTERCANYLKNPLTSQNNCNCLQSLSVDLHQLYKDESSHDVKLLCGEESTSAHRHILSARSSLFKAILKNQKGQNHYVEVEGMGFDVLQQLLRYIYTGILPAMTEELAGELLRAADSFEMSSLRVRCDDYLLNVLGQR